MFTQKAEAAAEANSGRDVHFSCCEASRVLCGWGEGVKLLIHNDHRGKACCHWSRAVPCWAVPGGTGSRTGSCSGWPCRICAHPAPVHQVAASVFVVSRTAPEILIFHTEHFTNTPSTLSTLWPHSYLETLHISKSLTKPFSHLCNTIRHAQFPTPWSLNEPAAWNRFEFGKTTLRAHRRQKLWPGSKGAYLLPFVYNTDDRTWSGARQVEIGSVKQKASATTRSASKSVQSWSVLQMDRQASRKNEDRQER